MSTAYLVIEGLNFPILLERLKKHGISVLKIEKISDKRHVIRVKYKDIRKVFAISQNMWYNKLIRLTGAVGAFDFFKRKLPYVLAVIAFTALAFFCDGLILNVNIKCPSASEKAKVYSVTEVLGIKKYQRFSKTDVAAIERNILRALPEVDFVTVKKSGYTLVIDVIGTIDKPLKVKKRTEVFSKYSGKIRELKVYSGTALKCVGDVVVCGEKLADGYYVDGKGNAVKTDCMVAYSVECAYEKQFVSVTDDEVLRERFIAEAVSDCTLLGGTVIDTKISKTDSGGEFLFNVKISYLMTEE